MIYRPNWTASPEELHLHRLYCSTSLIAYTGAIAPWFIVEEVHCVIASYLEAVARGEIDRLMIFAPPRTGKPIEENQLVLRGDGVRVPLKDIQPGQTVVSDRGRPCRVEAVHQQGYLPTITIETKAGRSLTAALDHPVLTPRGWVNAGDIVPGDVLATLDGCGDLGQNLGRDKTFRLAGYFIGDGNTTKNGASIASNITCFDPVQREDIIACAIDKGFKIGNTALKTRIAIGGGCRDWLRQIGVAGVKASNKRVPSFVFSGSNEEIAHFVGAYFACDGSIFQKSKGRKGWTIEFGSISRGLLEDVQHLLMRLGIASYLTQRDGTFRGRPYLSYRLCLYSEAETAKFVQRIPVIGIKNERLTQVGPITTFKNSYVGDPVVRVELAGKRQCRCLTVAEDQTFLASDLIVHNSTMSSVIFPSWWSGRFPTDKIMQIGYKTDLPKRFSRQVRSIVMSREYQTIFPGVEIAQYARAAGYWNFMDINEEYQHIAHAGEYQAAGVTAGIAGSGFHLGNVDDPLSEQDKDSKIAKDRVWEWWGPGFYTRRQPEHNAIVLTMCMTADTPVLMSDGTEKPLGNIHIGDAVMTWTNGKMKPRKVLNWRVSGEDEVLEIRTGGNKVRANARHPFLVRRADRLEWVPASSLVKGDELVVSGRPESFKSRPCSEETAWLLGVMLGDGWTVMRGRRKATFYAQGMDEVHDRRVIDAIKGIFGVTMTYLAKERYWRSDTAELAEFMATNGVTKCKDKWVPTWVFSAALSVRMAFVDGFLAADGHKRKSRHEYSVVGANRHLIQQMRTIARSCGYKVRNISQQTMTAQPPGSPKPVTCTMYGFAWTTWPGKMVAAEFGERMILSIKPAGRELVYDLMVESSETFIADGIVVHNTRWATDDLAGHLLDAQKNGGDHWEVLNIPAILDGDTARRIYIIAKAYGVLPDIQEMKDGESFSPVRIPTKELMRSKANMTTRDWLALYMGSPVEDEGQIIKINWWKLWPKKEPPECVFTFQMYDTAYEEHEKADFSAMTTWGVFEYTGRDGRTTFNMILLDSWKRRIEAPDLPKIVTAFCYGLGVFETEEEQRQVFSLCMGENAAYVPSTITAHRPDAVMIENKASGITLIKELRRRKKPAIPVRPWNPPRGLDNTGRSQMGKFARAQLSTLTFEQGAVWYMDRDWAAKVIDGCGKCRFDGSDESDDLEDTVTASVIYVRQTYRVELEAEINEKKEAEEELEHSKAKDKRYYGSG